MNQDFIARLFLIGICLVGRIRDPSTAELQAGAQAVVGDLAEPRTLGSALPGVDGVFLLPGPEYVDAFLDFYANGSLDESRVTDTVRAVTGRQTRTFRDWAARHADEFR